MRIENSLKNMLFGISGQVISAIMGFVVRTAFIYTLGIEYLGIDGLFSSILMMLSLANLGFDSAIIYNLYKPLAEKDQYKIQALINLYQKAYRIIGIVILIIGLSLMPFLSYLMNGQTSIEHINIIYLIFLLNSVSSYFFVYKHSIIIADQRNHIISKIHSVFVFISNIIQIILLILVGNYILVLITQVLFRIIENGYIAKKANNLYPFLKGKNDSKLTKLERKAFFKDLYSLFLYKISGVVINGTDNIIISIFIGVTTVGVYSNYLLIITTLTTFLGYIFYSITASVGNVIAKEGQEKKYFIFRVLNFSNFWIYGFFVVCLWNLINPFITIWLGEQYVFNKYIVFAILVNFYTTGMQDAPTTFRDTTGLFNKGRYRPVFAVIINVIFSIILANQIGIAGVILGTVISRFCTYFWYDPYVIFKYVFNQSVKIYFLRYIQFTVLVFMSAIITDAIGSLFFKDKLLLEIIVRILICLMIPNFIFYLIFKGSEEFNYLLSIVKAIMKKYARKKVAEIA